jgi:hypothetical protein
MPILGCKVDLKLVLSLIPKKIYKIWILDQEKAPKIFEFRKSVHDVKKYDKNKLVIFGKSHFELV